MKKILFLSVLLLLYFIPTMSYAQFISALENIAGNRCTLERDPAFYTLHDSILSKDIKPGLDSEIINSKIQDIRSAILKAYDDKIRKFDVQLNKDEIELSIDKKIIPIIKIDTTQNIKISKEEIINTVTSKLISMNIFKDIFPLDNYIKLFSQASVYVFMDQGIGVSSSISLAEENDNEEINYYNFYKILAEIIINNLYNYIPTLPDQIEIIDLNNINKYIQGSLDDIKQKIRDDIVFLLDKIEGELENFIASTNSFLLSTNIGLAITSGNSSLSPGILIGSINPNFNLKLFVTGIFPEFSNPPTDTSGQKYNDVGLLTGGIVSYRFKRNIEFQILLSYHAFQEELNTQTQQIYNQSSIFEQGIGINFNIPVFGYRFILTPVHYFQFDWELSQTTAFMSGLRIKKARPKSLSFFIGLSEQRNEDIEFIFQVGVPFNIVGN